MSERIKHLQDEINDSRSVVLALLGTVAGRITDDECVAACRQLVANLQARWGWTDENAELDTAHATYYCFFCRKAIKVPVDPEAPPLSMDFNVVAESNEIHMRIEQYMCTDCSSKLKDIQG